MKKIRVLDDRLIKKFNESIAIISTFISLVLIFCDIPDEYKKTCGLVFILVLFSYYLYLWRKYCSLEEIEIKIDGSTVNIKSGDLFKQRGYKAIAFNEYYDTQVDDVIISGRSLNGLFITQHLVDDTVNELNEHISKYPFPPEEILGQDSARKSGKTQRYDIGSICVYKDYLLTAFSKFNEKNMAHLTMPEYLEFLIKFWDNVNRVYSQECVSVPIFGSGITRFREHKNISDEELLKIMLWTFRISEMRFKYPAKLTIVIHKDKIKNINLLDIELSKNGL
ncbi:macro domain-containing protein [Aeromonas allosaccharophila]|uniref:macro domain-containing protein n=1 Tax=Aeromonas allosaccharophila TaxID=656 RepID=UPI003D1EC7BF